MAAPRKTAKSRAKVLPTNWRTVVIVLAGAITTIGGAIIILPPAWSVSRWLFPAWIGYVDDKVEQAQAPVLRSLGNIEEGQVRRALQQIEDDLLKVEIEITQGKDVAKRAAASLQKNKLLKDQAAQEKILENIAKARTK